MGQPARCRCICCAEEDGCSATPPVRSTSAPAVPLGDVPSLARGHHQWFRSRFCGVAERSFCAWQPGYAVLARVKPLFPSESSFPAFSTTAPSLAEQRAAVPSAVVSAQLEASQAQWLAKRPRGRARLARLRFQRSQALPHPSYRLLPRELAQGVITGATRTRLSTG